MVVDVELRHGKYRSDIPAGNGVSLPRFLMAMQPPPHLSTCKIKSPFSKSLLKVPSQGLFSSQSLFSESRLKGSPPKLLFQNPLFQSPSLYPRSEFAFCESFHNTSAKSTPHNQRMTSWEAVVPVFSRHLTSEWKRKKLPYRFDSALQRACTLSQRETERIFLDTGFQAWLSYFLANQGKGKHSREKTADLHAVATLEQLPIEQRQSVAALLVNTRTHPTVRAQITKLSQRRKTGEPYKSSLYLAF